MESDIAAAFLTVVESMIPPKSTDSDEDDQDIIDSHKSSTKVNVSDKNKSKEQETSEMDHIEQSVQSDVNQQDQKSLSKDGNLQNPFEESILGDGNQQDQKSLSKDGNLQDPFEESVLGDGNQQDSSAHSDQGKEDSISLKISKNTIDNNTTIRSSHDLETSACKSENTIKHKSQKTSHIDRSKFSCENNKVTSFNEEIKVKKYNLDTSEEQSISSDTKSPNKVRIQNKTDSLSSNESPTHAARSNFAQNQSHNDDLTKKSDFHVDPQSVEVLDSNESSRDDLSLVASRLSSNMNTEPSEPVNRDPNKYVPQLDI